MVTVTASLPTTWLSNNNIPRHSLAAASGNIGRRGRWAPMHFAVVWRTRKAQKHVRAFSSMV